MSNLFRKAAIFTDIHFGLKSNSLQHNIDCANFVDWFIDKSKKEQCDTCFFLGDYNHHRASINIQTLQFGLKALEKLNQNFSQVYFIPGNHDLYYRDRRDIHSVEWANHLPNVHIVNDFFKQDDVVICPWLVQDDYKKIKKMSGKYLFGHLELPYFYMNAMVEMPDHGEINEEHFVGFESAFSGHFHKRQARKNIWYIGNAFPHNYADAGDDARGMMILEWGENLQYYTWPNQPTFRTIKLTQLIDEQSSIIKPKQHLRVSLDVDISYEESNHIKEEFFNKYEIRELTLIPEKREVEFASDLEIKHFESVDQIVMNQLTSLESDTYNVKLLTEIYNNL